MAAIKPPVFLLLTAAALFVGSLPWLGVLYTQQAESGYISVLWLLTLLVIGVALACLFGTKIYCQWALRTRFLQQPLSGLEQWLHLTTFRLALRRQITPPRIAVYPSREFNAFAVGLRRHRSVIVLSEGLVQGLKPEELESVVAHEISHIANGDVQSLALLQGVLTVFIDMPARLLDRLVAWCWPGYSEGGGVYIYTRVLLQLAGGWLASLLVMRYSRVCEFRADRQAASLVGTRQMCTALRCLDVMTASAHTRQLPAFGLSERLKFRFMQLFNSHPSLFERLQALRTRN